MFHPSVNHSNLDLQYLVSDIQIIELRFTTARRRKHVSVRFSLTPHSIALTNHINRLMFWAVDQNLYNVDELTKNAEDQLQRAIERDSSPEDISLLREALVHV